jgi:uncharacterized membrane protein YeaQ/YmgE (transglycosylase-associated protein family)
MDISGFFTSILASPFICLGWIIVGGIAGALARQLTGASDKPFIQDLILGILGAIVGGFIAGIVMGPSLFAEGGLTLVLVNLVVATIGAVILIMIRRAITGSR